MPKIIDDGWEFIRGFRFEVLTFGQDVNGKRVPVTWSFADRTGAVKLAARHKTQVREVKRGSDAEDRNSTEA